MAYSNKKSLTMKKITILAFVALSLFSSFSFAKPISSFDNTPSSRVMDYTDTLTSLEKKNLEEQLEKLKGEHKSAEGFIVLVDTTDGKSIDEYSNALFRKWQIGNKDSNNGLLVVIAMKARKYRTEVGYGLEGDLTDGFLGNAMRESFKPYFKSGKFYNGLSNYINTLDQKINKKPNEITTSQNKDETDLNGGLIILGAASLFFIFMPLIVLSYYDRKDKKKEKERIILADREAELYREQLDSRIKRAKERDANLAALGLLATSSTLYSSSKGKSNTSKSSTSTKKSSTSNSKKNDSDDYSSFGASSYSSSSSSSSSSSFDSGGDSGGGGSSGDW